MKEYDYVEVIVEKEKYAKQGVHKGMRGTILDPRSIDGQWLVFFENDPFGTAIKEEDLKLIFDSPTGPVVVRVELLNDKYESQGVRKGSIGYVYDIMGVEDKWEVEFGDKKLMLVREDFKVLEHKHN